MYADLSDDEFGGETLDATQDLAEEESEGSLRDFIVDSAGEEDSDSPVEVAAAPSAASTRKQRLDQLRADRLRRSRREPIVLDDTESESDVSNGVQDDQNDYDSDSGIASDETRYDGDSNGVSDDDRTHGAHAPSAFFDEAEVSGDASTDEDDAVEEEAGDYDDDSAGDYDDERTGGDDE